MSSPLLNKAREVIRYLNLHHPVTRSLAQSPTSSAQVNLPLVVGTANNLYKLQQGAAGSPARINRIIIDTWLEKIDALAQKFGQLQDKLGPRPEAPRRDSEPVSLRLEVADDNELAQRLAGLFEQADKLLMQLESLTGHRLSEDKYKQFCRYFSERLLDVLQFTHQQNPELNARILRADL